ncbi:MAG TPA: MarR family transcriptional regulator [Thermoleophilaceae bacterium]|jgi:DNA-binding MarR family transcriptional regulator
MDEREKSYRLLMADVYELAGLSRRISGREAGARGATASQWHVLSVLAGGPAAVPEIAERLGVTRQGAQRVVNELTARGWIRRMPADRDARSPRFALTAAGRKLLAELWSHTVARREAALASTQVGGAELEAARQTLRTLLRGLRSQEADRGSGQRAQDGGGAGRRDDHEE